VINPNWRLSFSSAGFLFAFSLFLAGAILTLFQTQTARQYSEHVTSVERQLASSSGAKLTDEKTRQETLALALENQRKSLALTILLTNVGAILTTLAALSAALIAVFQYLGVREKERLDRGAAALTEVWKGLSVYDEHQKALSVGGLQHFLVSESAESHQRIASALAVIGRLDNYKSVLRTFTPVVELAMRQIALDILKRISWQGLKLHKPDLSGLQLSGLDFRDSSLADVDFTNTTLTGCRFDAAKLNRGKFNGARLVGSNFEFADLAGATMNGADLQNAKMREVRILGTDFDQADLRGVDLSEKTIDWSLAMNWRRAILDKDLADKLFGFYGPLVSGNRVLMLMWEFPPFVSGGGWTAAFHLLKNLRRRGADLVVLVPWQAAALSAVVLGNDIEVVSAGNQLPQLHPSDFSVYSDYQSVAFPYGAMTPSSSAYEQYTSIVNRVEGFTNEAVQVATKLKFDIIHAQDWLAFSAASQIANATRKPWVAHFHSTEQDRRGDKGSSVVRSIEQEGASSSMAVLVPSEALRSRVIQEYKVDPERIIVAPNCLSEGAVAPRRLGTCDSRVVVFCGRLTWQKGPDIFLKIAKRLTEITSDVRFRIYGTGDADKETAQHIDLLFPQKPLVFGAGQMQVRLGDAAAIDFDSETGLIGQLSELTQSLTQIVAKQMYERGFSAVAVQARKPFTHRIALNASSSVERKDYLVVCSDLPDYGAFQGGIVSMKGFVPWEQRSQVFEGCSAVVVSSRSEPFGLIVLEAMQHGVPVLFPGGAGVSEVVTSGIRISIDTPDESAAILARLMNHESYWQEVMLSQLREVGAYHTRGYESRVQDAWDRVASSG
jgi:glycosyltransferase involved in cell wall biosynthesis/uncharacterized protein YjbI with pentapeptide repeats